MLVLNRRPGESIVIEPDLRVTVLSVSDRRVWIGIRAESSFPELRVSATAVSAHEARLEIVPLSSVRFDGDRVRITTAAEGESASAVHAGLAVDRRPGERVEIGDDLWVAVSSISKGNPSITFGGGAIGDEFSITLIRPAGSYVRLGVDAPNRRVYREELWEVVRAGGTRQGAGEGVLAPVTAETTPPGPPLLEPATVEPPAAQPVVRAAVPADLAAESAAG
jgi:sRNA-binding carbon storage regulator CsrA